MDQLSLAFHALADPTRRAILMRLAKSDATVNELAEPFDLRLPTISKHLKVLQQASLVSQTREAQRRHCHLESGALKKSPSGYGIAAPTGKQASIASTLS